MKVWNYVFITISMMLFFTFLGWNTGLSGVFDFFKIGISSGVLTGFDFNLSKFVGYLFGGAVGALFSLEGLATILAGGGITAGLFYFGKGDIAIRAGFASAVFAGFLPSLYFVLTKGFELGVEPWAMGIVGMIFIPYTIGFAFALIEFIVGGND